MRASRMAASRSPAPHAGRRAMTIAKLFSPGRLSKKLLLQFSRLFSLGAFKIGNIFWRNVFANVQTRCVNELGVR